MKKVLQTNQHPPIQLNKHRNDTSIKNTPIFFSPKSCLSLLLIYITYLCALLIKISVCSSSTTPGSFCSPDNI